MGSPHTGRPFPWVALAKLGARTERKDRKRKKLRERVGNTDYVWRMEDGEGVSGSQAELSAGTQTRSAAGRTRYSSGEVRVTTSPSNATWSRARRVSM